MPSSSFSFKCLREPCRVPAARAHAADLRLASSRCGPVRRRCRARALHPPATCRRAARSRAVPFDDKSGAVFAADERQRSLPGWAQPLAQPETCRSKRAVEQAAVLLAISAADRARRCGPRRRPARRGRRRFWCADRRGIDEAELSGRVSKRLRPMLATGRGQDRALRGEADFGDAEGFGLCRQRR